MDPLVILRNLSTTGEILSVRCSIEHLPPLMEMNPFMLYLDDIWMIFSTEEDIGFIYEICEFALAVGDVTVHLLTLEEIEGVDSVFTEDDWGMKDEESRDVDPVTSSLGLKDIFLEFMEESNSYLEEIESSILRLEKDRNNLTIVNEIFRPFHTIKGNCGYLGLKEIGRVCHSVETLLDGIRSNTIPVNQMIIDILFEATDTVKRLRGRLPLEEKDRFGLTEDDLSRYPSSEPIDPTSLIDKIGAILNLSSNIKEKRGVPKIGEILIASGEITEDQLNRALELQERRLGEILIEEGIAPQEKVERALKIQESLRSNTRTATGAIKVDTEKLDNLVNLVGELVITQTLISQNPSLAHLAGQGIQKEISHLGKITKEIQDQVMSMRMVPLRQTFQKMMRVVRDAAKKVSKDVELLIEGEDTELDKTVIDEISDPLIHILRNSVDHGIEPPEERRKKGKPEKGVINLDAFHKGGNIVIEIKDDGRGLCRDKIIQKAIEKGLIDDASKATDQEIYHLIFHPGFSTAEKVTDISGRGVGMDVVRKSIEKLRGHIDIQSKEGYGTTISIILPLTLAIIDGMVVQVGFERYIIPTLSIKESYRPKRDEIVTIQNKGEMCHMRGSLLPVVRLGNIFNIEPVYRNPWEALLVIVEEDGSRYCIMIDELIGQQQVVIKPLGDTFKGIKGISGGAILGDGKVGLILDVKGLMETCFI